MKGLHLIFILALSVILLGAKKTEHKTEFKIDDKAFEGQKKSVLKIPNAKGLEIHISGEIHSSEMLRIYEYNQQEQGEEIYQGQGVLKAKNPLIIIDDEILVTLNTKDKTTRKGATVEIKELKAEKFLEYVRKDIVEFFNKLEKDEHIEKIDHAIEENKTVLEKLSTVEKVSGKEINQQISELLRNLVKNYNQIIEQKKAINSNYQSLRKKLDKLAKDSKKWAINLASLLKNKNNSNLKESFEEQCQRWLETEKNFIVLRKQIELYSKTLEEVFIIIEENNQVLYEAANSIDLNIKPSQKMFEKLKSYDALLQRLDEDWKLINKLKENLKNNGFL